MVDPRDVPQVHLNVPRHVCHVMLQPFHRRQEVLQKSKQPVNIHSVQNEKKQQHKIHKVLCTLFYNCSFEIMFVF